MDIGHMDFDRAREALRAAERAGDSDRAARARARLGAILVVEGALKKSGQINLFSLDEINCAPFTGMAALADERQGDDTDAIIHSHEARAVPLAEAGDEAEFGGKAASLARALGAGLPLPDGIALNPAMAHAVAQGDQQDALKTALSGMTGLVAVRSSAIGEDSEGASFAGQHATCLGIPADAPSYDAIIAAVGEVWNSGFADHALNYRAGMGADESPRVAVVVQHLLNPDCAGVLFTRNPVDGRAERVAEAVWGLGEALVAALVTPDTLRIAPDGTLIAYDEGDKTLAIRPVEGGGTVHEDIGEDRARARCLDEAAIAALNSLAARCEQVYGGPQDIEWAMQGGVLYLLQSRPITTL